MSEENFLARWSRRKRGEVEPVPEPELPAVVEEEIVLPPPAETIPLADITQWLSKRLPDGWREAALRRVWSADIEIRDFIGPADYAWDFTVPDGVPGWGPLTAADDVAKLLRRVIGEVEPSIEDDEGRVPIPQELHQALAEDDAIPSELAPTDDEAERPAESTQ